LIGKLLRKAESGFVKSALEGGIFWPLKAYTPLEEIFILEAY
jgi:hypothetical protein